MKSRPGPEAGPAIVRYGWEADLVIRRSERVGVEKWASVCPIGDDRARDENPPAHVVVFVTRQPPEHAVILGIGLLARISVAGLSRAARLSQLRAALDANAARIGVQSCEALNLIPYPQVATLALGKRNCPWTTGGQRGDGKNGCDGSAHAPSVASSTDVRNGSEADCRLVGSGRRVASDGVASTR